MDIATHACAAQGEDDPWQHAALCMQTCKFLLAEQLPLAHCGTSVVACCAQPAAADGWTAYAALPS